MMKSYTEIHRDGTEFHREEKEKNITPLSSLRESLCVLCVTLCSKYWKER